ncbi:MAG: cytochrome c3 family protein [Gammaproteobacteria bacterium]|nr:cytochrome c3 family protein [Gammaproteobacteria bacterium]
MSDFKREDVATLIPYEPRPVEKSGKQDVVSTEKMCFSCHDGFTLDSRPLWLDGRHNHPVGMKPSDKVVLPEQDGKTVFPLNDDGNVYCGTCHSAHGLSWQESESPIFLRVPNVQSSMCMTCHERPADQKEGTNHPVLKALSDKPEKLAAFGGMFGRNNEVICQSCHTPHAARSMPLTIMDNRQAALCNQCHTDKADLSGSKHDMTIMAPTTKNRKGELVADYGPCLACHVVHDADQSAPLWGRESIAANKQRPEGLCKSCHKKGGLAKEKTIGAHSHPLSVSIKKLGISPLEDGWHSKHPASGADLKSLPLFDGAGMKTADADQVSCPTCHDPHNWSINETIKGDPKKIEGDGQSSFLRLAQGVESDLCINCHVDKRSVLLSKHNLSGKQDRAKYRQSANPKTHLDQGVCGSCHRAHNGRGAVMSPVERRKNQSQLQSICTSCHVEGGLAGEKTTGKHSHPLLRNLANVGNKTSLPLFNKPGQRHPKGRVDCATCHNPHQWNPTRPMSTAGKKRDVDGDAKTSFLRLPAAPGSDLCVDCHRNKRPVRGTDHDLRITEKNAVDHQGRNVAQTGVCGQCHSVHNAQARLALWARETAPDLDPQLALCMSCHAKGAAAESKIPRKIMRPHGILLWSNKIRTGKLNPRGLPEIPVFDNRGNRASVGRVRCASCHNPHIWDADKPREGMGKNLEGDVTNSFLRNASSSQIVCADCHGVDAIFRYKYFHGETSRRPHGLYR